MIAVAIFFTAVFAILGVVNNCLRNARVLQMKKVTAATAAPVLYDLLTNTNQIAEGVGTLDLGDLYPDHEWTYDAREVGTNGWFQVDIILQKRTGGPVQSMMTFFVLNQNVQAGGLGRGLAR